MNLGSYSIATPTVGTRVTVTQSTKGVLLQHAFNGPPIASGEIDGDTAKLIVGAFLNAFNGRISVRYVPRSDSGRAQVTLVESRKYTSVLCFLASAFGGRITIMPTSDNVASNTTYTAEAYIPFSKDGTVRLDNGSTIVIEFDSFTNAAVVGGSGNYDGVITLDGRVSPRNAQSLIRIDSKLLISGQTGEFDIASHVFMNVPPDLDKLTLTAATGNVEEITSALQPAYQRQFCKPVFNALGFERMYSNESVAYNVAEYIRGNIKAVTSTEILLMTAVALN